MGPARLKALRIAFLALFALIVGTGAWLLSGKSGPSESDAALLKAFERETGLVLAVGDSELSATTGIWRAEQIELRTAREAEPVLRAKAATLTLDVAELLRGHAKITRAVIDGARIELDLRAGHAARALDVAKLHARLPLKIEARGLSLTARTQDAGAFELSGVDLELDRGARGMQGRLHTDPAVKSALVRTPSNKDATQSAALALDAAVLWDETHVELSDARVTLGSSVLLGSARFAGEQASSLQLRGDRVSLADLPFLPVRDALTGKGKVELDASAQGSALSFDLSAATLAGYAIDRLSAKLTQEGQRLLALDVLAERGAERWTAKSLELSGGARTLAQGLVEVEHLDLKRALGVPGEGSGTLQLQAQAEGLAVRAKLQLASVELAAHRFDKGALDARFRWTDGTLSALELQALSLESKDASLTAHGKRSDSGQLDLVAKGSARFAGIELAGEGTVRGPLQALVLAMHVVPKVANAESSVVADVTVALGEAASITGNVALRDVDVGAYLPKLDHTGEPHGRVSGKLAIESGRWDDARSLEGRGEISALTLGYGDLALSSTTFPFALRKGRIDLDGLVLASQSDDMRWDLRGKLGLDRTLDLAASTQLPLAPLLASAPYVEKVEGDLAVELALSGKLDAIDLKGHAEPRGVEMRIGPDKAPWRKLEGRVLLEHGALQLQGVTGKLGTGVLSLGGTMALEGLRVRSIDLAITARDLAFEPQERFAFQLDADAALRWARGDALPKLSGRVKLTRLVYARHVQLPEAVLAIGRATPSTRAASLALDLSLEHSAPMVVRNDFLDVDLAVAGDEPFRIVGTDSKLGARGELVVQRGRALFRGAVLTVRKGRIAFQSETKIVPALDLEADAPAKRRPGALIAFAAHGDPSRFKLDLHCKPNDGAGTPPPFECTYDGSQMECGRFEELTALWACERP